MSNATTSMSSGPWTSPFDVFLDARVPALDGVLAPSDQSLFLELFFWFCAYLVYGTFVSEWLRSKWSKTEAWNSGIKDKIGVFCGNAQDDLILMNMLGIHHTCAGGMCLLGFLFNDPNMFRHGGLLELGFEIADVLSMNPIFPMYPYRHDNMKIDAYIALLFHHLPTVYMSILGFQYGLDRNVHCQTIIIWFLLGAAVSAFITMYVATRNMETQLPQATIVLVGNLAIWFYCRFYIFQREVYPAFDDVENDPAWATVKGTPCEAFMPKFGILLTIFNSIVMIDGCARIVRYVMRMFNGTTALEWGSVPLCRDDRFKLAGKGKKMD